LLFHLGEACDVNTNQSQVNADQVDNLIPGHHLTVVLRLRKLGLEHFLVIEERVVKLVEFKAQDRCQHENGVAPATVLRFVVNELGIFVNHVLASLSTRHFVQTYATFNVCRELFLVECFAEPNLERYINYNSGDCD
jgi:hypothetical protein